MASEIKDALTKADKELSAHEAAVEKAKGDLQGAFTKYETAVGSHHGAISTIRERLGLITVATTNRGARAKAAASVAAKPTRKAAATTKATAAASGEFLLDGNGKAVLNKDGTPRKRPGPSKGFRAGEKRPMVKASAPKKAAASTKKPGAPVRKAASVSDKISATKKAQKSGVKPTLREALISVFQGNTVKSIKEATDALRAKGLLPNSEKPEQYIGSVLSQESKAGGVFERADGERGKYRLAKKTAAAAPKAKTNGASTKSFDDEIRSSGVLDAPLSAE